MTAISKELRQRIPRLVMSLIMVIIFWILNMFVPPTLKDIQIPGLNYQADQVFWLITILIMVMFLARALSDALFLGDLLTDIVIKRLGIKEERSPKRALRDLIYIIVIVLVAAAVTPFLREIENIGWMLSTAAFYIALALIIVLIYDIGRIIYKIIEEKAEILAGKLAKIAEERRE
ncbi:hypothetical protein DRO54_03135 [Candidatus Bathyarchaeota archaeon]|nr:MAG: hypothetical protein DRO54_03135 [Candidatus Bathyarchaeota archaeon]